MRSNTAGVRSFLAVLALFTLLPLPAGVHAQDLVATEDLSGGSSVFVFRESRHKPQAKGAGGSIHTSRSGYGRVNSQITARAQKRKADAIAARRKEAATAANRKIALSNTLTAKAEGFLDNGQADPAITNFREALVQNPRNARAKTGLSTALVSKGIDVSGENNNEAAAVYFEEAARLDPQNDVAFAKLGAIYDTKGENARAIADYEKALAINPEYTTLYAPAGRLYLDAGDIAKADGYVKKARAANIDTADVRFLNALILMKRNENAEALAAFDQAIQMDPNNAAAVYYRGQVQERLGRTDDAIASYNKALQLDPTYSPAAFDLGVAYYNKADWPNAAKEYEIVVKAEPKNYQAHANLASTYRQMERFADANAQYKIASEGIKTADLYSEWGYCQGKVNDWDKSVASLQTAKQMSPDAVDNANVGWAYYNAGNAKEQKKDEAAAKADYEQAKVCSSAAIKQDPQLQASYVNLGATHNKLGEFQAAVDVLKTVLGMHSGWTVALNQLGTGYRGLGNLSEAIAIFKQVVAVDSNNVSGLYNLGEAYHASGNNKEAKKVNDKLKKVDPTAAARLDNVISGKIVVDKATREIQKKIPKIPRIPY